MKIKNNVKLFLVELDVRVNFRRTRSVEDAQTVSNYGLNLFGVLVKFSSVFVNFKKAVVIKFFFVISGDASQQQLERQNQRNGELIKICSKIGSVFHVNL